MPRIVHHGPRLLALATLALAVTALGGCTSTPATEVASPGATASPESSATASPSPEPTASGASPTAAPTVPAAADEFCALMLDGVDAQANAGDGVADALRAFTNAKDLPAGDLSAFHTAGDAVLAYAPLAADAYRKAAGLVDEATVEAGLLDLVRFTETFTAPVGEVFASAASVEAAGEDLQEVVTDPAVRAAMDEAAAAAPAVAAYAEERCGYDLPPLQIAPGGSVG